MTPTENVAANVALYMKWRGITQEELADRMTAMGIGFSLAAGGKTKWHRRSIGRLLRSERRIDIDELYGLALALETSVGVLLSPSDESDPDAVETGYGIGDLDPVGRRLFSNLLQRPVERLARPGVGLNWFETGDRTRRPSWTRQPSLVQEALDAARSAWEAAHPDRPMDEADAGEVLRFLRLGGDVPPDGGDNTETP